MTLLIAERTYGPGSPCIVAELSANHAGREDLAHDLIDTAARAGADAVKFQLYRPEDMTLDSDDPRFMLTRGPWAGRRLFDLYAEAQTPREWFPNLFEHARELGLVPFASVFAPWAVEYLERLGCPAYKIASAEAVVPDLIRCAAETGKPVIVSDGLADEEAMRRADLVAGRDIIRLRCVASYPATATDYRFGDLASGPWLLWGVSDHTTDGVAATVAVALGASMVEAHLWLGVTGHRGSWPLDVAHSYDPDEFGEMVRAVRQAAVMRRPRTSCPDPPEFARRPVDGKLVRARAV